MWLQVQHDSTTRPIGYWPRSLSYAKHIYSATQRKFLVIVWAVLLLRPYPEDTRLTIRTDLDSYKLTINLAISTGPARWLLPLSKLDFDVIRRVDIKRQAANVQICLHTSSEDTTPLKDDLPMLLMDTPDDNNTNVHIISFQSNNIIPLTATVSS